MEAEFGNEPARSALFRNIDLYEEKHLPRFGSETEINEWKALRERVTEAPFDFVPELQQAEGIEGIAGQVFTFEECLARRGRPHTLIQRYRWYRYHLSSRGAVTDEIA